MSGMRKKIVVPLRVVLALAASTCADSFLVQPLLAAHRGHRGCSPLELRMGSAEPRRKVLGAVLALGILQGPLARVQGANAADDTEEEEDTENEAGVRAVSAAADITDKVYMDIKIVGVNSAAADSKRETNLDAQAAATGRIVIGLYGKDAPETAKMFKDLFAGALKSKCKDVNFDAAIQREMLQKKQPVKQCKAAESKPVDLVDSTVWRIIQNERIDFGRLKGKFMLRQAAENTDENTLSHDRAGVVSTRKGGGVFEFSIAPGSSSKLDNTNLVFGQVLEGRELVKKLNSTPVKKYAGDLGSSDDQSATDAGCYYGSKSTLCGANKPLQKISVVRAGVL